MITGAAAIMALVLFAFGLADLTVVKAMGIGMGIAIVMDATIVRSLLVPATMRLLGRWNWWAPGPMVRLYEFLALGERRRDRPATLSKRCPISLCIRLSNHGENLSSTCHCT